MAEGAPAGGGGGTGTGEGRFDFLKHKVGPLPLFVWIIAAAGIYWFLIRKNAGRATDPAGNVGQIDPATGFVYGSPQDRQALAGSSGGGGASDGSSGSSGSTTAGAYQDNAAWGRAAINYLVGLGIDPAAANESIQQYLSSQTLTPAQQANVNLAIQAIGAPPTLPGPTGTPVPPVVTPPSGTVYATNPPTGLTVAGKTDTTVSLKWNASGNATGYMVSWGKSSAASDGSMTVESTVTSATAGGLSDNTLYFFRVQAKPAKDGAPFASAQTTTNSKTAPAPTPSPPPPPPSGGGGGGGARVQIVGHWPNWDGSLSGIGAHWHVDWHRIYSANHDVIEAAARAHGHASSNGGNLIFPGTRLVIP